MEEGNVTGVGDTNEAIRNTEAQATEEANQSSAEASIETLSPEKNENTEKENKVDETSKDINPTLSDNGKDTNNDGNTVNNSTPQECFTSAETVIHKEKVEPDVTQGETLKQDNSENKDVLELGATGGTDPEG